MGGSEYNDNEGAREAKLWTGNLKVVVNSKGRFHIIYKGKRFTLDSEDVDENAWQNWRNEDRTIEEIRQIIFKGRSLDPYPQKSWNDEQIIKSNWPDMKTTLGPVKLGISKRRVEDLSLFIEPESEEIGKTYEVLPRGIITLNKEDESVILAFQIDNRSKKIDKNTNEPYKWGAWTILPFVVSKNNSKEEPTELIGYPVKIDIVQKSDNFNLKNKWNYLKLAESEYIVLNPFVFDTQEAEKCFYNATNWAIMAWSGREEILLIRTVYNHTDQFQVYDGQPEYVELEATGPIVKSGEKSTVVTKLQFIQLSDLEGISFSSFDSGTKFKEEFLAVLRSAGNLCKKSPFLIKNNIAT